MRYLGIDHGLKRIGLAVGDSNTKLATPIRQLMVTSDIIQKFRKIISEYQVDAIVIGLPLMENGQEAEQAKIARQFGLSLQKACHLPILFWDERLSSHTAAELLNDRQELTNKKRKARQDSLAAQTILQSFLNASH